MLHFRHVHLSRLGRLFLDHQPLFTQVRLEIRVTTSFPIEVKTVAHEAQARDTHRNRTDHCLRHSGRR